MNAGWTLVPLAAATPQPWRNGGGITRELLVLPPSGSWRVRVSVADVAQPGPFSRFAGVERWFAVLEGDGVVLAVDGGRHRLDAAGDPFRFDGGAEVDCSLAGGATRDLNLMAPPGRARMRRVHAPGESVALPAGTWVALYAHAVAARVADFEVPPHHLAWQLLQAPLAGTVSGGHAFWMEVAA